MNPLPLRPEHGRIVPRGQPVIALAMILAIYIAMRITFIALESDPERTDLPRVAQLPRARTSAGAAASEPVMPPAPDSRSARLAASPEPYVPRRGDGAGIQRRVYGEPTSTLHQARGGETGTRTNGWADVVPLLPDELAAAYELPEGSGDRFNSPRRSYFAPPAPAEPAPADTPARESAQRRPSHWSADGWLLIRSGDQPPGLAAGNASYGGSQAGTVVRYAFARGSALRPQAYVRVSGALGGRSQQSELALGLMARPLRRVPIAVLGEWRLLRQPGQMRTRPVAMAITQLPPLRLPMDIEADVYAQGGWAGGRDPTMFYDVAATFQHRLKRPLYGTHLSAGGGVWSGGQRGAQRLDLGPHIELSGMVGPPSRRIGVRVGVDWRFRVAGKALPGSGPALTVATGF